MYWMPGAIQFDSSLKNEIDKKVEGQMELKVDLAIHGKFIPDSDNRSWGLMLTRAWQ